MTDGAEVHGFELVEKVPEELEVGEGTHPHQGGRFRGVSIGRSDLGFFAFTHRARSKTWNTPKEIPDDVVTFIRSTG
jgi:hypothetical protein